MTALKVSRFLLKSQICSLMSTELIFSRELSSQTGLPFHLSAQSSLISRAELLELAFTLLTDLFWLSTSTILMQLPTPIRQSSKVFWDFLSRLLVTSGLETESIHSGQETLRIHHSQPNSQLPISMELTPSLWEKLQINLGLQFTQILLLHKTGQLTMILQLEMSRSRHLPLEVQEISISCSELLQAPSLNNTTKLLVSQFLHHNGLLVGLNASGDIILLTK